MKALQKGVGLLDGIVDVEEEPSKTSTSTPSTPSTSTLSGTRAARQDPPPRALVLLCDGMLSGLIEDARERAEKERSESGSEASSSSSFSTFPHLDAVARGGAVGTLALRKRPESVGPRRRHEALYQLLGAHLVS